MLSPPLPTGRSALAVRSIVAMVSLLLIAQRQMLSLSKFMLSVSKQNLIAPKSNLIASKVTTSARLDFLSTLRDIGLSDILYPTLFAVGFVGLVG
jgi:hypothetical protein